MTTQPNFSEVTNRIVTIFEQGATETLPPIVQALVEREFVSGITGLSLSLLAFIVAMWCMFLVWKNREKLYSNKEGNAPVGVCMFLAGVVAFFTLYFAKITLPSVFVPEGQVAKELFEQTLSRGE